MEIALLGDSVFDNRRYVSFDSESVENVLRSANIPCTLYAVDGAVISDLGSQLKSLYSKLKETSNVFISIGGNNALGSLHLVLDRLHLPEKEILINLKDFLSDFQNQLNQLYNKLSKIEKTIPVYVTNIYYPCFEFMNRGLSFQEIKALGFDYKIRNIVDILNTIISSTATKNSLGLVDINSAFDSKTYYANEIEPSFQGSQLLSRLIIEKVKSGKNP